MAHEGQSIKLMPNQIWNEITAIEISGSRHPATNWEPKCLLTPLTFWKEMDYTFCFALHALHPVSKQELTV